MNLTLDTKICKSEELIEAPLDESIALMSIENGKYYGLENVAKDIWNSIESPKTINQIVENLLSKYEVDREVCEKETLLFLEKIGAKSMIKIDQEV